MRWKTHLFILLGSLDQSPLYSWIVSVQQQRKRDKTKRRRKNSFHSFSKGVRCFIPLYDVMFGSLYSIGYVVLSPFLAWAMFSLKERKEWCLIIFHFLGSQFWPSYPNQNFSFSSSYNSWTWFIVEEMSIESLNKPWASEFLQEIYVLMQFTGESLYVVMLAPAPFWLL